MKSKFPRNRLRVRKMRRYQFEELELRRMLAQDVISSVIDHASSLFSNSGASIVGTARPQGEGETAQLSEEMPVELMTVDQVFPSSVLPPPVNDTIGPGVDFDGRIIVTGARAIDESQSIGLGNSSPTRGGISALANSKLSNGIVSGSGNGITPNPVVVSLRYDVAGYEGDTVTFQVVSSAPISRSIVVNLAYNRINPNGADAGSDYTPTSSVTIPAFTTFVGVNIPFLRDAFVEPSEMFTVRIAGLSVPTSVAVYDPASVVNGAIYDVPPLPPQPRIREISIANASGREGTNSNITFTLTASNASLNAPSVSVSFETRNLTAIAGQDYVFLSGRITFAPNQSTVTLTVPIIDDTAIETTEYFNVFLTAPSSNAVIRTESAVGTIFDNDTPVRISVSDAPAVREGQSSQFIVWLDNPSNGVSGTLRTRSGSATENIDYQGGSYPFNIPSGSSQTTVSIPTLVNNDPPEANSEDYFAMLQNVTGAIVSRSEATGTIQESTPAIRVRDFFGTVMEGNTTPNTFWVLFEIDQFFSATASVSYQTQDNTAFSISDYVGVSGFVTFTKGIVDPDTRNDYQKFVRINTRPDFMPERPTLEDFFFRLGEPVNATISPMERSLTLKIQDDDNAPVLTVTGGQAEEGNDVPFTFSLDKLPPSGSVTVLISTSDGTARDGIGELDKDYEPIGGQPVNNAPSPIALILTQLTTIVNVRTYNDPIVESDENFLLNVTADNSVFLSNSSATGRILDNDSRVRLTISPTSSIEGDQGYDSPNKMIFPVNLSVEGKPVTVPIAVTVATASINQWLPNGAPNPRYAAPIADYMPKTATLVFAPGASSASFDVDINGDEIPEQNEEFLGIFVSANLAFPNTTSGTIEFVFGPNATGTIIDDDLDKPAKIKFDFERILDEDQNCVCTSALGPSSARVSIKDGSLVAKTDAFDSILELRSGGNNSYLQLQSLLLTRGEGTDVPDKYTTTISIGGLTQDPVVIAAIPGDANRRIAYSVPTEFFLSTGMYQGSIAIDATKAVRGGNLSYKVTRQFRFKVINDFDSAYTYSWWNPQIERLYPQKTSDIGNIANPNFGNGALYVRGDQTAWWFDGGSFNPPDGLFAKLTRAENNELRLTFKNGEVRVFNTAGILNRVIDRNGNITRYSYIDANADGVADELASITDPFNRVTTYAYSGRFLASVKDPFNRETVFTIQNNRLTRITGPDPDGSGPRVAPYYDFAYTWNSTGQSILQTDAENEQHRYTFNRFGRVTRIDLPDGTNWRYQYLKDKGSIIRLPGQSSGVAVTPGEMEAIVTNPRGFQTKYQTDRFGLPTKIDYPDGSSEAYKRNRHGQPEEHVYPSANGGNSTAIYSYDAAQNLIQRTSPEGGTQTWEYESNFSLPIRYAQTGRPITVFFRDSRGNVTQVQTLAMQTAVGTANNVANRGLITALYSNPIDRFDVNNDGLVAESDATTMIAIVNAGSTPTYEETPDGRPVYPDVDGDGRLSPLDVLSVLNRLDAPQTRSESFTYSNGLDGMPSGMLLSSTDANNETTLYEYFPMNTAERGFLRRVLRSDGVFITPVAAYTYNSEGNVVSSADLYGRVTQYTVDRLDQVTEVRGVAPDGQDANRPKTKYAYSVMGHLNSITDPGDRTISIGRNRVERRLTLTRLGGTSSRTTTQIFDPMGNLISIVDPIDRLTTYEYDSMDRLVKTKLPAVSDSITTLELNYNKAGMVTSEKDALGTTTTYAYSSAGDLLRVSRPNPNSPGTTIDQVFGYSSPGILSSATDPLGNVTNYVVDNFGQLAKILRPKITTNEGRATETIAYDNAGRRRATSEATGQYQLVNVDLFGRLTSVESMDPDRSGPGIRPVTTFATPVMVSNTIAQNITIPTGQTLKITTDLRGRQTSYEIPRLNGAAGTLVATTQYDSLDRVVSQTSISGATSSFTYDEYDQLLQVNPPNPATATNTCHPRICPVDIVHLR